jgi:hypothetical protein
MSELKKVNPLWLVLVVSAFVFATTAFMPLEEASNVSGDPNLSSPGVQLMGGLDMDCDGFGSGCGMGM